MARLRNRSILQLIAIAIESRKAHHRTIDEHQRPASYSPYAEICFFTKV